jgi:hypothetical protein
VVITFNSFKSLNKDLKIDATTQVESFSWRKINKLNNA